MRFTVTMKIHHVLLVFIVSALWDGNGDLVRAETFIRTEGGSLTAACTFSFSGRGKLLRRDACKDGDILIETEGEAAQRGRYSIGYREGTFPVSSTVLHVSITQLTRSDAGRYCCVLKRPFLPDSHQEFQVAVTDGLKTPADEPEQQQTEETGAEGYVLPLSVCVAVLFAAVVLLLYSLKLRSSSDGLTTRGQSHDRNDHLQIRTCQKCADFPCSADPVYTNL